MQAAFDGFLHGLSIAGSNRARAEFVAGRLEALVDRHPGLGAEMRLHDVRNGNLERGVTTIEVDVPSTHRKRTGDRDDLIYSAHTDSIALRTRTGTGPGVNDNGSGCAVLYAGLADHLDRLDAGAWTPDAARDTYLFFTGEEGSRRGLVTTIGLGYAGFAAGFGLATLARGDLNAASLAGLGVMLLTLETMAGSSRQSPGLSGSTAWTNAQDTARLGSYRAAINFDMVGRYHRLGSGAKAVIVPHRTIGLNPRSWFAPESHEPLATELADLVLGIAAEQNKAYAVRHHLSLGSSDHVAIQQRSRARGAPIPAASFLGIEGAADPEMKLHTTKDLIVSAEDIAFSRELLGAVRDRYRDAWKTGAHLAPYDRILGARLARRSDGVALVHALLTDAPGERHVEAVFESNDDPERTGTIRLERLNSWSSRYESDPIVGHKRFDPRGYELVHGERAYRIDRPRNPSLTGAALGLADRLGAASVPGLLASSAAIIGGATQTAGVAIDHGFSIPISLSLVAATGVSGPFALANSLLSRTPQVAELFYRGEIAERLGAFPAADAARANRTIMHHA